MLSKCAECYKDNKKPSDKDCLKCENDYKQLEKENEELKKELQRYKDMETKGLEEFKDIGGCWGCGIQLTSDQYFNEARNYRQGLEAIKRMVKGHKIADETRLQAIEGLINKVLESEGNNND